MQSADALYDYATWLKAKNNYCRHHPVGKVHNQILSDISSLRNLPKWPVFPATRSHFVGRLHAQWVVYLAACRVKSRPQPTIGEELHASYASVRAERSSLRFAVRMVFRFALRLQETIRGSSRARLPTDVHTSYSPALGRVNLW